MDEGAVVLVVGAVLAASIVAAIAAARTGLPLLIAFLALGMLLGSDGPGGIEFDDVTLTREIGTVGLGLILFEGGLQTSWRRLREVALPAALLSTVGVVVSALVTGVAAYALFDLSWLESILLGAVVASTDAAAVFATLRFTRIRRRLARTLEAESGGNDPMAIALTLGLIAWIDHPHAYGLGNLLLLVLKQIGIGLGFGVALGALATWVFARIPASVGAFAPVASVAAAALAFGAADFSGGSGFLAVYLVGLAVGSTPSRFRRQLVAFHEGVAFVYQVVLFVVLGLLVFPHQLVHVALPGLALTAFLVVVGRPAAVWVSTALFSFTHRERALLGWAGLRGAAPIVVATFVLSDSQIAHNNTIFNAVFFVVVVSTLVQGTTLEWVAEQLRLVSRVSAADGHGTTPASADGFELLEVVVQPTDAISTSTLRELGLPRSAVVTMIGRGQELFQPNRDSRVRPGDRLVIVVPQARRADLDDVLTRWRRPV